MIRIATAADLDPILEIVETTKVEMHQADNYQWNDNYPLRADFQRDIDAGTLVVDEEEGVVAGFMCINYDRPVEYAGLPLTLEQEKLLIVHRLAVRLTCQGKGVATALLRYAEETARRDRSAGLLSDTSSVNEKMNRMLQREGYQFVGHFPLHHDPRHPFCCYEKVF